MELIYWPDPRLLSEAKPIGVVDEGALALSREMIEIMHRYRGIGLAGNQVGVLRRLIVVDPTGERDGELALFDPVIESGSGTQVTEEGCLSFPGIYGEIERRARIVVRALGLDGGEVRVEAQGLLAVVLQHEIDHLDGIVFTTKMTPADRARHRKRLLEMEEQYRASHA